MPRLSSTFADLPASAQRNHRRFGVVEAAVALSLAMGVLVGSAACADRDGPAQGLTAGATAGPGGSPSAVREDSPVPLFSASSPSARASASSPPTPAARPAAAPTTTQARPPAAKPTPTATCKPYAYAIVQPIRAYNDGKASFGLLDPNRLCPDVRVRVFWATYRYDDAGVGHLTGSRVYWLDRAQPTVQMQLPVENDCHSAWFIARGNDAIPTTLAAGVVPFSNKLTWDGPACR